METNVEQWVDFYYNTCKFSIIPIKERDKKPNIPAWEKYKETRPTKDEIQSWLNQGLFKNIAVIGGKVSGNLVCFDIDDPKAFIDLNLDPTKLIKQGAWVVETPKQKGRYHVIVRDKNNIGVTRKVKQDIDMRANGHYWVVYPSIHPNGKQYNLLNTHNIKELELPIQIFTEKMFDDWIKILYEQRGVKETLQDTVKTKKEYDESPDCIRNAWELGATPGGRYYAAVGLGSWLQQQKFPLEMAKAIVIEWFKNKCNSTGRPIKDIESAVGVGFTGRYQTGCNYWKENTDFCPYENRKNCGFLHTKKFEKFNTEGKFDLTDFEIPNLTFEPVLNSGNIKWLIISPEKTFEIKEPSLWKCKRCNVLIQSETKPIFCNTCERETKFDIITDSIDPDLWKLPTWNDIPVEDLDMQNIFIDMMQTIKQCIIFSEEIQYKLYTLWIISTWKTGEWETIPFLIFRGLVETGKTRALDIIRELGYRTIHASGISIKAVFRFGDVYGANILIDEIDNKIDHRTESGREMIDYLKPSYRKGSYYYAADREDPKKVQKYKNFGFKAFAGEKGGYDQAIFSRSIDFQMEQDYPDVTELKTTGGEFNNFRTTLLNYRYKTSEPPELPEDIDLKGRDREIYSCIIRTAMHIGIEYNDITEFIRESQKEKQDETKNSDEYQILKIIHDFEHQPILDDAPETISYADIAEILGWEEKKRQKLGYIFKKKLILKTKRMTKGSVVLLNDPKNIRKLKSLYRRFKL